MSVLSQIPLELLTLLAERRVFLAAEENKIKYRAPEGALDETLKKMLRENKEGILKTLQGKDGYSLISPLSYNQQSLFFMYLMETESAAYNLALSMSLQSSVDATKMRNALAHLVQRHEQLRTTYGHIELSDSLIPVQFIREYLSPSFETINASKWSDAEMTDRLQEFYRRPFDLEKGPVLRAGLFVKGTEESVFILALHHIAADAWSMNLIRRDLAAAYGQELKFAETSAECAEYTDYTLLQRRKLETAAGKEHLDYWVELHSLPAPMLDLSDKSRRPALRRSVGETHFFRIDQSLSEAVQITAQKMGITPFAFLLSVFQWLIFERSGKREISIGIPIIGHNERRFEDTVGYFVNPVALRSKRNGQPSFREHAQMTAKEVRLALDHREAPFAAVVERLSGARDISRTPVFQIMFNMLSRQTLKDVIDLFYPLDNPPAVDFGGIKAKACPLNQQEGQFDLTLELIDYDDNILGLLKYCTDLFTADESAELAVAFQAKIEAAVKEPEISIITTADSEAATVRDEKSGVVAISASFTAEFLQEYFAFWFERLGLSQEVRFAPFNQVFQALLDPSSLLRTNTSGYNVIIVRLEDLLDKETLLSGELGEASRKITQVLEELKQGIATAAQATTIPLCFVLCPPSPRGKEIENLAAEGIEKFLESVRLIPGVTMLIPAEINRWYPITDYYEPLGETIGSIPFTRNYLAVLATAITRSLHSLSVSPVKAIAIDCDGTLWQGVVGEDGPEGVVIGPWQRAFQEFLLKQYQAGVILCLCSKNQEADVWAVFDRHPEMILRREHISFWKINWEAKSVNLNALAKEINIGLDTFAFLDDNPLERAEVQARCPSVLCVEFPEKWEERAKWLEHYWALDHRLVTKEDKKRQDHYRSEQIRDSLKQNTGSLAEFLEKLELKIDLQPAMPADYERLAQLSIRTNQFNTTTLRLTTKEVAEYATTPGMSAHVARVRDRFGDYGLVGAMLAREREGAYHVDGMFLSCRALGRSVEYRMASYLAHLAQNARCNGIVFPVKTTERNEPARTFLSKLNKFCGGIRDKENSLYLDADKLAVFRYEEISSAEENNEKPDRTEEKAQPVTSSSVRDLSIYNIIAGELNAADAIFEAVEQKTKREKQTLPINANMAGATPETQTEKLIADVWKRVLGLDNVNTQAKFFEVGGTSLLMVRIAIELKRNHNLNVSIIDMFKYPTIADLASHLEGSAAAGETSGQKAAVAAALRQRETLSAGQLPDAFKRLKKNRASTI